MEHAEMTEGLITDEALEKFRERIGTKLRIRPFNELATPDSIRKFADGIGDPNPLWRDEEYAKGTKYGCIIAPPSWLYSVFPTWVLQGLPGVHAFHSGNDWEFYKPIKVGDKIRPECIFTGFEEKQSKFSGRMVMEYQEARYYNQRDELVAKAGVWLVRAERRASREKGKYAEIKIPHPWTEEELDKIDDEIIDTHYNCIRGSNPRFWEDTEVGEESQLVKGPLSLFDEIAYTVGSGVVSVLAHGMAVNLYRRHPAWGYRDPETHTWMPIYAVHFSPSAAKATGNPYAFDVGVQRQSWLIQMLTNWIGDEGWIKRCYAEYRRFVYLSDVVWIRGKVVRKYRDENGEPCVDIETHAVNQRGEDTMPGNSTVILPTKDGYSPVKSRML